MVRPSELIEVCPSSAKSEDAIEAPSRAMSAMNTLYPAAMRCLVIARPIPEQAPVISATGAAMVEARLCVKPRALACHFVNFGDSWISSRCEHERLKFGKSSVDQFGKWFGMRGGNNQDACNHIVGSVKLASTVVGSLNGLGGIGRQSEKLGREVEMHSTREQLVRYQPIMHCVAQPAARPTWSPTKVRRIVLTFGAPRSF